MSWNTGKRLLLVAAGTGAMALVTAAALHSVGASESAPAQQGAPGSPPIDKVVEVMQSSRFWEAVELADAVVHDNPASAHARAVLGLAELKAGKLEAAAASLQQALKLDPDCPAAHLGMGYLASGKNDLPKAARHFELATRSADLYDDAYRGLRGAFLDQGDLAGARRAIEQHRQRLISEGRKVNAQTRSTRSFYELCRRDQVLRIPADFRGTTVKLLDHESRGGDCKQVEVRINDQGPFLLYIDSAFRGNLAISPVLADELGLERAGEFLSRGVGPESPGTQGAWLDRITIGDLQIEDVPVLVLDSATYRGKKQGLLGTGLLKLFSCTIDVKNDLLELFPRDGDSFRRHIDTGRVVNTIPFLIYPAPIIQARVAGGRLLPFTVDTAAGSTLLDEQYFEKELRPSLGDEQLAWAVVSGSGGTAAKTLCWPAATLTIGDQEFSNMLVISYDMSSLNDVVNRYVAGVISNDFLWQHRAHFDFARAELILEAYPEPEADL
jgi:predicted aspartyl protease